MNRINIRHLRKKGYQIIKLNPLKVKNKLPQIKGIVIKVYYLTPKKPNSALRKVARVRTKSIGTVIAYIPGEKHSICTHNEVLICPDKIQDLVNVNYRIIRGPLDAKPPIRSTSRSKYGTPKSDKK